MNMLQTFCPEGVAWKHLRHPSVLPLLGVTISEHQLAMVSGWMDNGNINQFIEHDQLANRPVLVRHPSNLYRKFADIVQLAGVANGLNYPSAKPIGGCGAGAGV